MAAKAITYVEIGQNGSRHQTFYSATGSVIDDAWTTIESDKAFTDTDGRTIVVRGARRWDTPRMRGSVCLGNIGGTTFDAQVGNMETQPGAVFTDVLDLNSDAYRSITEEEINLTIDATSEPAAPQITFPITELPDGGVLTQTYGFYLYASLQNTSGAERTFNASFRKNGVELTMESWPIPDGERGYAFAYNFDADITIGDELAISLTVDDESIIVVATSLILAPRTRGYNGGDLLLLGTYNTPTSLVGYDRDFGITEDVEWHDPATDIVSADSDYSPSGENFLLTIRPGQVYRSTLGSSSGGFGEVGATPTISGAQCFRYARIWSYR